jgi:hypothetical protein
MMGGLPAEQVGSSAPTAQATHLAAKAVGTEGFEALLELAKSAQGHEPPTPADEARSGQPAAYLDRHGVGHHLEAAGGAVAAASSLAAVAVPPLAHGPEDGLGSTKGGGLLATKAAPAALRAGTLAPRDPHQRAMGAGQGSQGTAQSEREPPSLSPGQPERSRPPAFGVGEVPGRREGGPERPELSRGPRERPARVPAAPARGEQLAVVVPKRAERSGAYPSGEQASSPKAPRALGDAEPPVSGVPAARARGAAPVDEGLAQAAGGETGHAKAFGARRAPLEAKGSGTSGPASTVGRAPRREQAKPSAASGATGLASDRPSKQLSDERPARQADGSSTAHRPAQPGLGGPGRGPAGPLPGLSKGASGPAAGTSPAGQSPGLSPGVGPPSGAGPAFAPSSGAGSSARAAPGHLGQVLLGELGQLPAAFRDRKGNWSLSVQLDPPELGQVQATLTLAPGGLHVVLVVSTPAAHAALVDASRQISRTLGAEVTIAGGTDGSGRQAAEERARQGLFGGAGLGRGGQGEPAGEPKGASTPAGAASHGANGAIYLFV